MTTSLSPRATNAMPRHMAGNGLDIGSYTRLAAAAITAMLSVATLIALTRGIAGIAPAHPNIRELSIIVHVSTVLPAIPLGGYLLLARKGSKRHKQLGKLWIALIIATATSAFFIRTGGGFSFIHIFVPITLWASYKVIASARRGDIKAHKKEIFGLFFGALTIPGIIAFALPGRLMNVWLFW